MSPVRKEKPESQCLVLRIKILKRNFSLDICFAIRATAFTNIMLKAIGMVNMTVFTGNEYN